MKSIGVLVGSLRRDSINLKLAKALEILAADRFGFTYADIGALPHYNDDLWADPPQSVVTFKALVEASDGVLFVTPEYNRAVPGVLKNAIDWGSRPWGESCWTGKPASIVGASLGVIASAAAQSQLRSVLPVLQIALMGQPEVYLQYREGLFDENFTVSDDVTRAFLEGHLARFDEWIGRFRMSSVT